MSDTARNILGQEQMLQHQRWLGARARLMFRGKSQPAAIYNPPEAPPEAIAWGAPVNLIGRPGPRTIIALVARRRAIMLGDMTGPNRTRQVVAARDEAIGLIWTHCRQMSLPEMGRLFGNRDHTTILHTLRKLRINGRPYYRRRVFPAINRSHSDENETGVVPVDCAGSSAQIRRT